MIDRRRVFAYLGGLVAYAAMLPRVLRAAPIVDEGVETEVKLTLRNGQVQLRFVQDGYESLLYPGDMRSLADVMLRTADRDEGRKSFVLSLPADTIYVGLKGSFEITEHGTLRYGTQFIPEHINRLEAEFEKAQMSHRRRYDAVTGTFSIVKADG